MLHRRGRVHLGMWKCFSLFLWCLRTQRKSLLVELTRTPSRFCWAGLSQGGGWWGQARAAFPEASAPQPDHTVTDSVCHLQKSTCHQPVWEEGLGFYREDKRHFICIFIFLISLHQRPSYCFEWIHVLIWCDQSVIRKTCSLWVEIVSCI